MESTESTGFEHGADLSGLEGSDDEAGPRSGDASLFGVPVLEVSWLAIGVISVPVSFMDTDRIAAGKVNKVEHSIADDGLCSLTLTAQNSTIKV